MNESVGETIIIIILLLTPCEPYFYIPHVVHILRIIASTAIHLAPLGASSQRRQQQHPPCKLPVYFTLLVHSCHPVLSPSVRHSTYNFFCSTPLTPPSNTQFQNRCFIWQSDHLPNGKRTETCTYVGFVVETKRWKARRKSWVSCIFIFFVILYLIPLTTYLNFKAYF